MTAHDNRPHISDVTDGQPVSYGERLDFRLDITTNEGDTMKYTVEQFNTETERWEPVVMTDDTIRVTSNQYAPHVVFETDDPEFNG